MRKSLFEARKVIDTHFGIAADIERALDEAADDIAALYLLGSQIDTVAVSDLDACNRMRPHSLTASAYTQARRIYWIDVV